MLYLINLIRLKPINEQIQIDLLFPHLLDYNEMLGFIWGLCLNRISHDGAMYEEISVSGNLIKRPEI